MTACPVASTTSAAAARGSASRVATSPTATMSVPSMSTEPGSSTCRGPDMGSTTPPRTRVGIRPPKSAFNNLSIARDTVFTAPETAAVTFRAVSARHPFLVALEPVADLLGATLVPASRVTASDVPLHWEGELVGGLRLPGVHGTLERMIAAVETELGSPLASLVPRGQAAGGAPPRRSGCVPAPQGGRGRGRRPGRQPVHRLQLPERRSGVTRRVPGRRVHHRAVRRGRAGAARAGGGRGRRAVGRHGRLRAVRHDGVRRRRRRAHAPSTACCGPPPPPAPPGSRCRSSAET